MQWRLVADVGGTNVRFARAVEADVLRDARCYPVAAFDTFLAALDRYLAETGSSAGCIGVAVGAAGPVDSGVVTLTNGTWRISLRELENHLGGLPARLVNDLEAVAFFLPALGADDVIPLGPVCRPAADAKVMLAVNVGTGFGAAAVMRSEHGWITVPGEPGHMSLPRLGDVLDLPLTSIEDLLSGRGVTACYAAVATIRGRSAAAPDDGIDAQDVFARAAHDPAARAVVDHLSDALGRCVGDLVLAVGAWAGAFLCGSVVEGWHGVAGVERFRRAFEGKGAMSGRMRNVFTGILARPHPALHGLARLPLPPLAPS